MQEIRQAFRQVGWNFPESQIQLPENQFKLIQKMKRNFPKRPMEHSKNPDETVWKVGIV